MIYICQAFTLPCKLCDQFCKGCSGVVRNCCASMRDCISSVCTMWKPITQGPLGSYVVGTWAVMLLCLGLFGGSIAQTKCSEAKNYAYINFGLCVVHMCASLYIQRRIISAIQKAGGDIENFSARDITNGAMEVAKYDIGFCLYVFVFIGAGAWNCVGLKDFKSCEGTGMSWAGGAVKIMYAFLTWNYFFCWYGVKLCCGAKEAAQERKAGGAETVGASA